MEKERNEGKTQTFDLENESTETNPPESQSPPSGEGENEGESGETTAEPSTLQLRVTELEQQLEVSESGRRDGEQQLAATRKSLAEAVSRYRAMLLEGMPEAPESLVVGETVDEVDRSFAEVKAMVQQVRRDVEEKLAKERLPAGSPTRTPADFSTLTPMDKIRHALTNP